MELILNHNSWETVDVETFIELKSIDLNEYNTRFRYIIEQLCILSDTMFEDDIWEEMSVDDITKLIAKNKWVMQQPNKKIENKLILEDINYIYRPIIDITIGEYIDLDSYCKNGYFVNLDKILATSYKRYYINEFNNVVLEPNEYSIDERKLLFYDLPINSVYGVVYEFLNYKKKVEDTYLNLFENIPDEGEDIDETLSPAEKIIERREAAKEKMMAEFSWHNTMYNLAGGDLIKMKEMFNLKATYVFNMLSYLKATKS